MVSNRRGTRKGQPGKGTPPRLRADTLRLLRREARNLGLSTEEYMRMVLSLSSTLRKGLVEEDKVDARQLLQWVDNPLMLSMIQWVCRYALKSMNTDSGDAAEDEAATAPPKREPASARPAQAPPRPPRPSQQPGQWPGQVWIDPWGNVIQGPPPGSPQREQQNAEPANPGPFEEGFF